MGLVVGIFRKLHEKSPNNTGTHEFYTANNISSMIAMLGTLFIWIFFPILTFDYREAAIATHSQYTSAYTVMYALAAATISSYATSVLIN